MRLFYLTSLPYKDAKYIRATPHSQTDTRCHPRARPLYGRRGTCCCFVARDPSVSGNLRYFITELQSGRATYRRRPGRGATLRFEPESDASSQVTATSKPRGPFH